MRFEDRSVRGQVALLRPVAHDVLRQYPVEVASLRLLNHGFNTTFRVDTIDGQRFALRLNVNSRRTDAFIGAEMAWLAALSEETDLWVPTPQRTRDGALLAHVDCPPLARRIPAALFAWLPGHDLGEEATPHQMRAVGRAAAQLHAHGERWRPPAGTELPPIDKVLMDIDDSLADHPLLSAADHALLDEVLAHLQGRFDELFAGAPRQPLHADLHIWNLRWYRGRLAVLDFDDSGIGVPVQDLAICTYYLRDDAAQEAALLEGYQEVRALPSFTPEQFEALVASRNLVLLNDVVTTNNAEFIEMLPRYVPNSLTKLRAYLQTGVFRHHVAGLHPTPELKDIAMIAGTPEPPYTAVIFTSLRTEGDHGYAAAADAMAAMAAEQPGYLGVESARDGVGITVSYWRTAADAAAWKQVAAHLLVQRTGQTTWYSDYRVRVATVDRHYGPPA